MAKKLIISVAAAAATISADVISQAHRVLTSAEKHGIPEGVNAALVFNVDGEKTKVYASKGGEAVTIAFTGAQVEKPKNLPLDLEDSAQ